MSGPQTIDEYLDELLWELRGRDPSVIRRVLAETEDHLREAVSRSRRVADSGVTEAQAIRAFGPPRAIASTYRKARRPIDFVSLARQGLLFLGAVLLTIGLSGGVLIALDQAAGVRFAGREDYGFESVGRHCWPPPQNRLVCSREQIERLEDDARRDQLYTDVGIRGGLGVVGLAALLASRLIRPAGRTSRVIAAPRAALLMTCVVAGLVAAFFLYMGWSWGQTQGKQGEGWFYAWGLSAALTFAVASAWLGATAGKFRAFERRAV